MTKANAIKTARENVSTPFQFGDGWKFSAWEERHNWWRESHAMPYSVALSYSSATKVRVAVELMTGDTTLAYEAEHEYLTDGGKWTNYVPA